MATCEWLTKFSPRKDPVFFLFFKIKVTTGFPHFQVYFLRLGNVIAAIGKMIMPGKKKKKKKND